MPYHYNIKPQIIKEGYGPFGCLQGEEGYTVEEWGSIPPVPLRRGGDGSFEPFVNNEQDLFSAIEKALNALLVSADMRQLPAHHQDIVLILLHGYKWRSSQGEHDASSIALSHLPEVLREKWERLNWEAIYKSFPAKGSETIEEWRVMFEQMGKPLPVEHTVKVGWAGWSSLTRDNSMGCWTVRNPFLRKKDLFQSIRDRNLALEKGNE